MVLSRFAVSAPVKVTMIFVAVLVLGFISLRRLPTNLFPDIRAPKVTTTLRTVGLSPLEVERRICQPLERQLYTLRGVVDVTTIARADSAVIVTEFSWDTPLDFAFLDVKKAVADLQRQRPTEVESASVLRYDPNAAPVLVVGLVGGEGSNLEDLRRLARQTLRPRFERLEGVANVVVAGGREREARIALDEGRMLAYGLEVAAVVSGLRQENVNATGGYVTEGTRRFLLKAVGEFEDLEDVRRVVVARRGENPILLADVADVEFVEQEPRDIVLVDGVEAVGMSFYREAEGNTVAVSRAIREEIARLEGRAETGARRGRGPAPTTAGEAMLLPPGARLVVANDQAEFIRAAIREVRNNALLGGALAIVILMLFLRDMRTTLIIAVAIPISIIATFNLMYFQGLSLNLMTLGGLALGCGMLVDNAIVVLENIFRLRQEGADRRTAARRGTAQVAAALFASTLTTVVVFLPIVYVRGVAGLLFKEQALTVAYSLAASLLVALLLIPMLASHFLANPPAALASASTDSTAPPRTVYAGLLRVALRLRWLVVLIAGATMFVAWELLQGIPQEFLPRTEQRQVEIRLVLPTGTPIEGTRRAAETIVGEALRFREAIEVAYARVGESTGEVNANTEDPDGPNTADVYLRLHDWDKPTTAALEANLGNFRSSSLIVALKPRLDDLPDAKADIRVQQGSILELLGTSSAPLLYEIRGEEVGVLTQLAEEAQRRFQATPGLRNVRTNILEGAPEARIALDRVQLARLGLDVQSVATTIRQRLEGEVAGQIKREAGDIDLRVEVDYGEETLDTLRGIVLKTATGAIVPLGNIAEITVERGPREIVRRRQTRAARVMADLDDGVRLSEAITRAQTSLETMRLPGGYVSSFTGEEQQRAEAFERLGFALALSILLVYMVMASIFESFLQPLLIMATIPLAGVGVVAAFLASNQTLNIMGLIGVVMLGGIVVNNAIVLLDCVNQVRASSPDLPPRDSLVLGCQRRLRPVLMTTLTTLLGLLPLALGVGQGAELRQAMAVAVLGGLLSSTVLTLFVIPVGQSYLDSARDLVRRLRGGTVKESELDAKVRA